MCCIPDGFYSLLHEVTGLEVGEDNKSVDKYPGKRRKRLKKKGKHKTNCIQESGFRLADKSVSLFEVSRICEELIISRNFHHTFKDEPTLMPLKQLDIGTNEWQVRFELSYKEFPQCPTMSCFWGLV